MFKKEDRREADRLFSVLSPEFGRLEITGKSIRRVTSKLRAGMEIGNVVRVEFVQGKNQKTLTDVKLLQGSAVLVKSPGKLRIARSMCSMVDEFVHSHEVGGTVFNLLCQSFENLQQAKPSAVVCSLLEQYFFWHLMACAGFAPELFQCASCACKITRQDFFVLRHGSRLYFSCAEGGVLCKVCGQRKRPVLGISPNAVKALRFVVQQPWGLASRLKIGRHDFLQLKALAARYRRHVKPS